MTFWDAGQRAILESRIGPKKVNKNAMAVAILRFLRLEEA